MRPWLLTLALAPAAASYDEALAVTLAHYAQATYCPEFELQEWTCGACSANSDFVLFKVHSNEEHGVQAMTGSTDDMILVAFRGTQNNFETGFQDWMDNLNAAPVDYPDCADCKVHPGFRDAYMSVSSSIRKDVELLLKEKPHAKLYITGHSLGGALATVCAVHLGASADSIGQPVSAVYTFGSPRVGNEKFAAFFHTATLASWRITHSHDAVVHAPGEGSWWGYHHVANEVFYDESFKSHRVCSGSGEDNKCADQYWNPFYYSISYHLSYFEQELGRKISTCNSASS